MASTASFRCSVLALLVTITLGCQDTPTEPTTIGGSGLVLTGTWQGLIGPLAQTTGSANATWTISQTDNAVTGPIALRNPSTNVAFSGTMAGTLSGTQLPVTFTIPRGNVPNFPDCSMSGTGSLTASASLMSGTVTITRTGCEGFTSQTTTTESVSLTKQ